MKRTIFLHLIVWAFLETHADIIGKPAFFGCQIRWAVGADTSQCEREPRGEAHQKGE